MHEAMDTQMAMTDAEIEDFLSFMEHPGGAAGACAPNPMAAFAATDLSDEAATADGGAFAAAHTSSSDANGSSDQRPGGGDRGGGAAPRSPGSSEDCAAAVDSAMHHPHSHGLPSLGRLPEGEIYAPAAGGPAAAAAAAAAPMLIPGRASPAHHRHHAAANLRASRSVASMGSLTMPLEGLALGSPAGLGPLGADSASACATPVMMFGSSAPAGVGGMVPASPFAGGGAAGFHPPAGMMSMGAFGPAAAGGVAFVPSGCGSAPLRSIPSLASTLDCGSDGDGSAPGGCGMPQLSTSWPEQPGGGALLAGAAGSLPRSRSGSASKPPSGGARASSRGRSAGAASADATYHRSSGGNSTLSHSTIEKQRRDRLNALLDELGMIVPPSDGRADGSRRPKHVILSDAISLLTLLQEQLHAGCDEIQSLRMRAAAAEARAAAVGGAGAAAIDIAMRSGDYPGYHQQPGRHHLTRSLGDSAGDCHLLLPPTPSSTPGSVPGGGLLRCGSSAETDHALLRGACAAAAPPPPAQRGSSVVVEQEGSCVRVAVSRHDRDGLLGELVEALKGTGATIARAAITTAPDGSACDEFELRLVGDAAAGAAGAPGGGAEAALGEVRNAVLAVLSGGGGGGGARNKRTRQ
jgi:hypothetical protein